MGELPHPKQVDSFTFNQPKAIQAVAFLLKQKQTQTDNYMRLLKLLYIADRESLQETGHTITGDRFIAMERGPTLSHLLDLVKQRAFDSSEWDKYIKRNGYEITLLQDPGNDKLCRYEVDKLENIWQKFQNSDEWEIAKITEIFSEWTKNKPTSDKKSNNISLFDVLQALGRQEWFEAIIKDAQDEANLARKFNEV